MFQKKTGISRDRVLDLVHETHIARTERRQRAMKAELARRGVSPRVAIGSFHGAAKLPVQVLRNIGRDST